jgi:hypothetical protein
MSAQAINTVRSAALPKQNIQLYTTDELVVNLAPMLQSAFNLVDGNQWNNTFFLAAFDSSGAIYQVTSTLPLREGEWGNDFRNGVIYAVIPSSSLDGLQPGSYVLFFNAEVGGISRTFRLPITCFINGGGIRPQ